VPWQTCTAIGKKSWGYIKDNTFKNTNQIICDLIDIVSKNGILLLNVGPRADGTITEEETNVLLELGRWLKTNGEGIYGTVPWKTFGEGSVNAKEGFFMDGEEKGYIDFPPHRLNLGEMSEGEHTVDLILFGNRMNTFGQLHKTDEHLAWTGPDSWRTKGRFWTDEYMLTRTGILTAPRILTEE
jgi:hypothetical protein